jgi:hypothetical protein
LSPWAQDAKDHWKRHRPKMCAELEKNGTLNSMTEKAASNAENEFQLSVENGMDPREAWSSARQNHLFPPDEEDQPHLGESPISSQDPTNLATTTVSPKPITSGEGSSREKFISNADAIRTLKAIESEGRTATPAKQSKLVAFLAGAGEQTGTPNRPSAKELS